MKPQITVYGDLILDEYIDVERVKDNPEAGGAVYRIQGRRFKAGGAGAVASVSSGLDACCRLVAPIGDDYYGSALQGILERNRVSLALLPQPLRLTPLKTRHVCRGRLLPDRFDIEGPTEFVAPDFFIDGALIIADYAKGACSNPQSIIRNAIARQCQLIIVDPSPVADWRSYQGAHIIKANFSECRNASKMLGGPIIHANEIANFLATRLDCRVVLTKDSDGIYLNGGLNVPATFANKVDVCGAGDTVTAAIAVSMSSGKSIYYACQFAADMAARQIESIGVCQVCPLSP